MNIDILSNLHLLALSLSKPLHMNGLPEESVKREHLLSLINIYSIPLFVVSNILICFCSSAYTFQSLTVALVIEALMAATFFLCSKRSNRAYKAINSCLLLVMGPIIFLLSRDNLLLAMVFGFVIPNYILLLFQDIAITWLSCFVQFTILNLLYIPEYRTRIISLDYEELIHFTDQHLSLMSACFILGSFITLVIFFVYKNSSNELQEAKIKSETALTMQEKFFYKFSHELKNPLTGLLGNLEMAYVENIDPRVKNLIGNAKVCGELLLQLINNILDSGKMEVGNLDINYTPVRVTEIFEKIWGVSSEMIKNKGLYGQLTIYKKMPPILMLDSYRVLQVMLNIVRNAVRFTTNGRISITVNWIDNAEINDSAFEPVPYDNTEEGLFEKDGEVETLLRSFEKRDIEDEERPIYVLDTKQKHIPEILDSSNRHKDVKKGVLKITVSDTGCGLDEESVKGIFTLFPELVVKKVQEKTPVKGLSMWITQQVCEKMNGQIRLYSKPGRGSTFIVCINTESSRVEIDNSTQFGEEVDLLAGDKRPPPGTKIRALVMDDNPYNTDVIRKYLEKSHVDVVGCAKNGLEAINLYEKEVTEGRMIHIITMDLDMPLLDGKAACEKIREYEEAHNRPPCSILIVSGNCFETEIKECLNPNGKIKANYFIRKPMYFLEFQRLIQAIQVNNAENFREPFNPKKVLIVDDDLFNLQFLGKLLSIDKHEFFEARNGKEAFEIYKKHWKDIAVIFMDCEMVVMDGYTSTREIRKVHDKKKLPKIKIFGVTGHTGLEHEMKCKEAGMNQTVSKPFRHDDIRKIITECMNDLGK